MIDGPANSGASSAPPNLTYDDRLGSQTGPRLPSRIRDFSLHPRFRPPEWTSKSSNPTPSNPVPRTGNGGLDAPRRPGISAAP